METCLMVEWDTPKDDKRWKEYWDHSKKTLPYLERIKKEGILKDYHFWSDNTGHVVFIMFFEDENKFAKLWGDREFQGLASTANRSYDNALVRVMRPANVT